MTLAHMKRQIAWIKREANIDFEKQAYEDATERHWNRLRRMHLSRLINDKKRARGKRGYDGDKFMSEMEIAQRQSELDRALTGDTPEIWRKDQATIEAYHLENYGHLDRAKRFEAYGADEDEMRSHHVGLLLEGVREAEEQPAEAPIEAEYVERPREKPVRLHPSFLGPIYGGTDPQFASIGNFYTPEFADGRKDHDLAQFYPYSDYPEIDRNTVIEFYSEKS